MPFSSFTDAEIAAGEPVKQELWQKAKDNDDDFDDRLGTAEASVGRLDPVAFHNTDFLLSPFSEEGIAIERVDAPFTALAARLEVKTAGISGSVEIDLEYKRGGGAWTTILSGPISVAFGAGDLGIASGTLVETDFIAGDHIRLNINSVQNQMQGFSVYLEREVA